MTLKRKRTFSLTSSPNSTVSSSSTLSSTSPNTARPQFNPSTLPLLFTQRPQSSPTSQNESGRTLKRTHDNRPPEARIHDRTLGMLWEGQRRGVSPLTHLQPLEVEEEVQAGGGEDAIMEEVELPAQPERGQRSLGAFFEVGRGVHVPGERRDKMGIGRGEEGGGMDLDDAAKSGSGEVAKRGQRSLMDWMR